MRYTDDTESNEKSKEANGERTAVTNEMLFYFVGGDNPEGESWELLLDILNSQYPIEDAVREMKQHWGSRDE